MNNMNDNRSYSGLVEKYIGTAYDKVAAVADNLGIIIKIGDHIDDIIRLYEHIDNIIAVANDLDNVNAVADALTELKAIAKELHVIRAVEKELTNIREVAHNLDPIVNVADELPAIRTLDRNINKIITVVNHLHEIDEIIRNMPAITAVGNAITDIKKVSKELVDIRKVADNLKEIIAVGANIPKILNVEAAITQIIAVGDELDAIRTHPVTGDIKSGGVVRICGDYINILRAVADLVIASKVKPGDPVDLAALTVRVTALEIKLKAEIAKVELAFAAADTVLEIKVNGQLAVLRNEMQVAVDQLTALIDVKLAAQTLDGHADVDVSHPADGVRVAYDADKGKWIPKRSVSAMGWLIFDYILVSPEDTAPASGHMSWDSAGIIAGITAYKAKAVESPIKPKKGDYKTMTAFVVPPAALTLYFNKSELGDATPGTVGDDMSIFFGGMKKGDIVTIYDRADASNNISFYVLDAATNLGDIWNIQVEIFDSKGAALVAGSTYRVHWQSVIPDTLDDHAFLLGRADPDQHPMTSITGLPAAIQAVLDAAVFETRDFDGNMVFDKNVVYRIKTQDVLLPILIKASGAHKEGMMHLVTIIVSDPKKISWDGAMMGVPKLLPNMTYRIAFTYVLNKIWVNVISANRTEVPMETMWSMGAGGHLTLPIPIEPDEPMTIDWGDGVVEKIITAYPGHVYTLAGEYRVKLGGENIEWRQDNLGDKVRLREVLAWGNALNNNFTNMFHGCSNLVMVQDISREMIAEVTDISFMFAGCSDLTEVRTTDWDTRKIVNMDSAFADCSNLSVLDVSNWAVGQVKNMEYMFSGCSHLLSLDVSDWDTRSVTDMSSMFANAQLLATLDPANWKTDLVTSFEEMFLNCTSLTSLELGSWNTSRIMTAMDMFKNCSQLRHIVMGSWTVAALHELEDFLLDVPLAQTDYDEMLIAFVKGAVRRRVIIMNANLCYYSAGRGSGSASMARDKLVRAGWVITDAGER